MKIHFSVDDTIQCFKYLTDNKGNIKSIFDSYIIQFGRDIYERFGIKTSYYCMFTDGNFTLEDATDFWVENFQSCLEWMRFGFHAFAGDTDYSGVDQKKIGKHYDQFLNSINRITGGGMVTNSIRLHAFKAGNNAVKILADRGIRALFCADDDRGSYDLTRDEELLMKEKHFFCHNNPNMIYYPTDIRIENVLNDKIRFEDYKNKDIVSIFTHERLIGDVIVRRKTLDVIKKLLGL